MGSALSRSKTYKSSFKLNHPYLRSSQSVHVYEESHFAARSTQSLGPSSWSSGGLATSPSLNYPYYQYAPTTQDSPRGLKFMDWFHETLSNKPSLQDLRWGAEKGISSNRDEAINILPSNTKEMDRLDQEHYLFRNMFQGKNFIAPFVNGGEDIKRCLDIGHGTGIWMLEMASAFPEAVFHGLDVRLLHPTTIIPTNCRFQLHNVLKPIPFADGSFDYIHQRNFLTSLPAARYQAHFQELYRLLTPQNGYLECMEASLFLNDAGPAGEQINAWLQEILLAQGVDFKKMGSQLEKAVQEAGFTAEHVVMKIPTGLWGNDLGLACFQNFEQILEALKQKICKKFGVCTDEFEDVVKRWRREANEQKMWWELRICLCRR